MPHTRKLRTISTPDNTIWWRRYLGTQHITKIEHDQPEHETPRGKRKPSLRAGHGMYPKPHNYKLRLMNQKTKGKVQCFCDAVGPFDPHTGDAEIMCRCRPKPKGVGRVDYLGEASDTKKVYMRDDLRLPGSQAGRFRRSRRLRLLEPEFPPA